MGLGLRGSGFFFTGLLRLLGFPEGLFRVRLPS